MTTAFDIVALKFLVTSVANAFSHRVFDEDGREVVGECFNVYVTAPNGRRWVHTQGFLTILQYGEDSQVWAAGYEESKAKSENLAKAVAAALTSGLRLDQSRWIEVDPAYGSQAYQAQGCEAQRWEEEVAAG